MLVIWRVASTPVMPGMFRSITTTSGASSRTERIASAPAAASPTTWIPAPRAGCEARPEQRSWSSTIRTRRASCRGSLVSSVVASSPLAAACTGASLLSVQRDVTVRRPHARASAIVGTRGRSPRRARRHRCPPRSPPRSPGMVIRVPSGITDGSTAAMPQPVGEARRGAAADRVARRADRDRPARRRCTACGRRALRGGRGARSVTVAERRPAARAVWRTRSIPRA